MKMYNRRIQKNMRTITANIEILLNMPINYVLIFLYLLFMLFY